MKKNNSKLITVIVTIIIFMLNIYNILSVINFNIKQSDIKIVSSEKVAMTMLDGIIDSGNEFISTGTNNSQLDINDLGSFSNDMYSILLQFGIAIAVIVGIILGIKYMVSSVEERAEVKGMITIYVVSAIVIFGAAGIWRLVVTLLTEI